jgi:hypothetical protein
MQRPEDGELITRLHMAAEFGHWPVICELRDGFPESKQPLEQEQLASLLKTAAGNGRDGVVFQLLATTENSGQIEDELKPQRSWRSLC